MPAPKSKFKIPGVYHETEVYIVGRRYLYAKYRKLEGRGAIKPDEQLLGFYNKNENVIFICKELAPDRRFHTLMHEIVHMIEDETEHLEEEAKADLVGKYLAELFLNETFQADIKSVINNKRLK